MVDITALKSKIVSTIFPNGVGAINAADHQSMLLQIADAIGDIAKEITELSERSEENETFIEDLQNTKIDKEADDYYPQLSVGLSDNLAGVDVVESKVSFRRSGGGAISDGVARIEAIKGNSVVWNQKVKNNLTEATINGVTFTPQADGGFLVNGTASANSFYAITDKNVYIANHKVALFGSKNDVGIAFGGSIVLSNVNKDYIFTKTESFDNQCFLFVLSGSVIENIIIYPIVIDLTLMFGVGNEPTTIEEFYARIPMGVDLNAYNEGEVIHTDAQSLESVGVNQWDEKWEVGYIDDNGNAAESPIYIRSKNFIPVIPGATYYMHSPNIKSNIYFYDSKFKYLGKITRSNLAFDIPRNAAYIKFRNYNFEYGVVYKNDICINLSDASIDGKYFPYIKRIQALDIIRKYFPEGMKSARAAHEEIRYNKATQKWEKVQRIGSVDMGNLTWRYASITATSGSVSYDVIYAFDIQDICKLPAANSIANILSYKYIATLNSALANRVMEDKSIMLYSNGTIYIRDTAYTDAASFKAAMQGVMLYYELAEPIVTELDQSDQFKDLDYQVWNAGTEKAIAEGKSAPLAADITYGFNAIGKIKELESLVAQLRAKVGI